MFLCVLFAFSCKDEEAQVEPSMKERLSKEWRLTSAGERLRKHYTEEDTFKLVLRRDGTYFFALPDGRGSGKWNIEEREQEKFLILVDDLQQEKYKPLLLFNSKVSVGKLSESCLTLYAEVGSESFWWNFKTVQDIKNK